MYSVEDKRIHNLNGKDIVKGDYVLYWMQQSQRAKYNHALCHAIQIADSLKLPVLVFFGIDSGYPSANLRHYRFMIDGLAEVERELKKLGIKMITWIIEPVEGVLRLAENAAAVVADFGYLKHQLIWRKEASSSVNCLFLAVESDVIVPVETASAKEEYSAATFRPKITALMKFYSELPPVIKPVNSSLPLNLNSVNLSDIDSIMAELDIDKTVMPVANLKSGTPAAEQTLKKFIELRLDEYPDKRNHPSLNFSSELSPYLHFGQISPLFIVSEILKIDSPGRDVFLEELIVRRDLSINFVYYNKNYDSYDSIPPWAAATLKKHQSDRREYLYSRREFEESLTHDIYWNAAQNELVTTGKIHNYMRMYWGKKFIEWTESPEVAFDYMVYLNNKYAIDGRDVNSYTGIAWCLGKHDRPWKERPVFGTVRYMNDNGLKRKFDMSGYIKKFSPGL
ncbi:MAG TPA: deoxyribodipyrimidine photo-lyase [Spirochaetota bacterium]|nr:deoxyribodipyrimidine photo-lyase [Spirochaetota bacterium]